MKALNYLVSNNGLGIAVGIIGDRQQAQEDATLAENIYGCNTSDELFGSLIYMRGLDQLKKFLILKEYFKVWDEHWSRNEAEGTNNKPSVLKFTRAAITRARTIMNDQVRHENFMYQMAGRNQEYSMGGYQDEAGEE